MLINWLQNGFGEYHGYGRHGIAMVQALTMRGVGVKPFSLETLGWPSWLQIQSGLDFSRLSLTLTQPQYLQAIPGRQWAFTMYESTELPKGWTDRINDTCERLLVPSTWLVEVFRQEGVRCPISVVPEGIWPHELPLQSPRQNGARPYTFMVLGDRGSRKGFDVAWRAFWQAFGDTPDVRFLVKCRKGERDVFDLSGNDSRVAIWRDDVPAIADMYSHADCFVFPTRGEGWGLPAREAAGMGIPVIATEWSGLLEGGIHNYALGLPVQEMRPSRMAGGGYWAEPDVQVLVERMRWCYENQEEAWSFGRKAAQWLRDNQTWLHAADRFIELLEQYA